MLNNITETVFGYYPDSLSISARNIAIQTLPDLEKHVAAVNACGLIEDGWLQRTVSPVLVVVALMRSTITR